MAKDIYWNNVVCLLHCDDLYEVVTQTNATAVGSPTFDTTYKKFGTGSLRVTASNYITLPDSAKWDFGTGAFTIEFFMRLSGANYSYRTYMGHNLGATPRWWIQADYNSRPQFYFFDGSNTYTVYAPGGVGMTSGLWVSACIQRDASGMMTIWLSDGTNSNYYQASLSNDITGGTGVMQFGSSDADMWFDEIRITKGVARYTTSNYAPPTDAFPEADHEIYPIVIDENLNAGAYVNSPGGHVFGYLFDALAQTETMIAGHTRGLADQAYAFTTPITGVIGRASTLGENVTVTEASSVQLGALLRDFANLAESLGVQTQYTAALLELVRVQDAVSTGRPVTVQDTVSVTWALGVVQGATLAEKLGLQEVLNYPVRYRLSASDALRVYDALARFLHFDLAETISAQDTMTALSRHMAALSQSATASDTLTPRLLISAVAQDGAVLDDAFDLKMIYQPEVHEQVIFTVMFASPSGGVTTWAVNTRTGAVTEYENYAFNSFAQSGNHYLGATADGLYALDGDDDAGTSTVARLKSGYAQFGSSRFTAFAGAYLGMRGDGNIFLKLDTGDGKSYTYKTVIQDQQTTKVRLGKGLRARYFSFELITEGQDFDLDTVEFLPLVAQRRV